MKRNLVLPSKIFFVVAAVLCTLSPAFGSESIPTIPFYETSKPGKILIHEEGYTGNVSRRGMLPVGKSTGNLKIANIDQLRIWSSIVCDKLGDLKNIHFPAGAWPKSPGKSCAISQLRGYLIEQGALAGFGILEGFASSNEPGFKPGRI